VLAVVSVAGGGALQAAADTASDANKMVRFIGWTFDLGLNCSSVDGSGRLPCQSVASDELRITWPRVMVGRLRKERASKVTGSEYTQGPVPCADRHEFVVMLRPVFEFEFLRCRSTLL
jgi:hypothetical protein